MGRGFTRLAWWLFGNGKGRESAAPQPLTPSSSSSSEFGTGPRDPAETMKFPSVMGPKRTPSKGRRWRGREERRMDGDYDIVDVGYISGSESDSDWSIGWSEPHGPDFMSEGEGDSGFAVLVPCYGRGYLMSPGHHGFGTVKPSKGYSSDGKNFIEQWLSSLQSMEDI